MRCFYEFSESESYSEPFQALEMECFAKLVKVSQLLTISTKRSNFDACQGSEYVSVSLWQEKPFHKKAVIDKERLSRKFHNNLHITETDNTLQSIRTSKYKLTCRCLFVVVTWKSSKDDDKRPWLFGYMHTFGTNNCIFCNLVNAILLSKFAKAFRALY